jgi:hypothetical protein
MHVLLFLLGIVGTITPVSPLSSTVNPLTAIRSKNYGGLGPSLDVTLNTVNDGLQAHIVLCEYLLVPESWSHLFSF